MKPRVLVLTGYGINCDYETEYAFSMRRVGGTAERVHVNDIIDSRAKGTKLSKYHILAVPGGFSYGDDIGAGKALANKLQNHLRQHLEQFIRDGKLIIGICNGFQVLVKMGLLPAIAGKYGEQHVTLMYNDSNKFEDRWVYLAVNPKSHCIFTKGIDTMYLPVRHGEGKLVAADFGVLAQLHEGGHVALQYVNKEGKLDGYPSNPNGSQDNIAGLCDPTGRIFGLMPHPEAYLFPTNHPRWTREKVPREGMGVAVFRNAVKYVKENL
ncbi:MAG: phosphoribosylformylglycinamidine synthase subunit PurQ [Candidatus Abyssobacteria bacterium SURF_17]|uniref:Phosphoribosylformylglycinamidine synthase subunit PurQ n=1 Tax=Candidatus Abyssobacteria bacterium SURF_17 TaxID=2093361 RepID=A0A419F2V9_9BACT|nr:MAG: phosphoribosylformylglycinamidine synthase subunit PurQ [Candidatus Abyssubacteria bacterium SURF_17]